MTIAEIASMPLSNRINFAHRLWRLILSQTLLKLVFGKIGRRSIVYRTGLVVNGDRISIGERSVVRYGCRLEVVRHGQAWEPQIAIGDDVNIEQNVHIVCHDRVIIRDRVSITGHCAIVDVTHPHVAGLTLGKIGRAIDEARSLVEIGEGSFIGFGTTILPNVKIGKMCVIGAGSVVTTDIPDYSVAAGAPARVLSVLEREAVL